MQVPMHPAYQKQQKHIVVSPYCDTALGKRVLNGTFENWLGMQRWNHLLSVQATILLMLKYFRHYTTMAGFNLQVGTAS